MAKHIYIYIYVYFAIVMIYDDEYNICKRAAVLLKQTRLISSGWCWRSWPADSSKVVSNLHFSWIAFG